MFGGKMPRSNKPWIGVSEAHRQLVEQLRRLADVDVEVLISGETGVGKEQYARHLHTASGRNAEPFVAINCGALPAELFENELFGHVGGAFTGARGRCDGLVAAAEKGTLFFDEIDALAPQNQVKVLRLIQEREYRRLGDPQVRVADVRIIAATNRDLVHAARIGAFREDLLFRLRVVPLEVPPLRARTEDIDPMFEAFAGWYAGEYGLPRAELSTAARAAMVAYPWPGNIRELENVVRRLTCLQLGRAATPGDLALIGDDGAGGAVTSFRRAKAAHVRAFERSYLEAALASSDGNIAQAARAAGKPRRAFFELMRKHGITTPR